ncbi:MAG: hypothetical protein QOI03_7 [Solirubrobacteraceae bacterium]|jgi:hypothetical protein|nr:hypothetical protein [Solirubrobacteraceae bacterium]
MLLIAGVILWVSVTVAVLAGCRFVALADQANAKHAAALVAAAVSDEHDWGDPALWAAPTSSAGAGYGDRVEPPRFAVERRALSAVE